MCIRDSVYIKDVVERNKLRNVDEIDTLVDILASWIGAPSNPTKISNTYKSERGINYSNKTISNHVDYLVEAFLISKADRYDIKGRKYVGANPVSYTHLNFFAILPVAKIPHFILSLPSIL